jgi:hypothetical protein
VAASSRRARDENLFVMEGTRADVADSEGIWRLFERIKGQK